MQTIQYFELKINCKILEINLTEDEMKKIKARRQNLLTESKTSILELTNVIGLLTSTTQALLPARLQFQYFQL